MASTRTRIKPIRITNETADYFENKPLNRIVENLMDLMKSGKVKFDGEKLIINGISSGQKKNDYESIAEMASLMKVTTEQLLSDMNELLENGELYYSGGKLRNPIYVDFENRFNENEREKILEKVMREYGK